jgi:two-component system chemotaxis response regulator CheY
MPPRPVERCCGRFGRWRCSGVNQGSTDAGLFSRPCGASVRFAAPFDRPGVTALRNLEKNVLVVDDYNTMRRILRNLLSQIGFSNVEEAEDGSTGLRKLRERSFGLVISDWNMAPMSGLEFLKEVRSDGALKDMPFIMITAESKTENVVAAKEAGVSNYIVKPFNADTLKKKIEAVLGEL